MRPLQSSDVPRAAAGASALHSARSLSADTTDNLTSLAVNPFSHPLAPSNGTSHFGPVPTAPVAPTRQSKASGGRVWVFSRGPQVFTRGSLDDPRAR
mgnify:CR=1 FL=1